MMKLVLSLTVVLAAAGLGIGDDAENDLKKLAGTWEEVSHTADGKAKTADEVKGRTVVIDASGKWEAFQDGTSLLKGTVKLDPAQKPRAADWTIEGSDMVAKSIYEVDGDTWKHCFSLTERPKEFGSKEGSGVYYIVLKRVKK
ncbi:MAG TPA: TIGR03067 domain-containing protein [Gemmataceae bacterium]|nr:TIGR03067 domain-containing protein [Gemmataceae bacterium]